MNEHFEVGEIALIHNSGNSLHGVEVTIIEGFHPYVDCDSGEMVEGYTVAGDGLPPYPSKNGKGWGVHPMYLRKHRPPQDWVKLCHLDTLKEIA